MLLILGFALYFFVREALLSGIEDTVHNRAAEAAQTIDSGEELDEEEIEQLTSEGVFLIIRDEDGTITTQPVTPPALVKDVDTVWQQALQSGYPQGSTTETSDNDPIYIYAVPVAPTNSSARVVEAGQSYEGTNRTIETFGTVLIFVIVAAFMGTVGGAYILARAALSPVGAVLASAHKITEGGLSERLPVANSKDEIASLAVTMNGLLSRLEAAFARQQEALKRQEEALEYQRRFVADASHELRTPLTTIEGYAEMLKEWALHDQETAHESVDAIQEESKRMRVMVESMLALAQGDEGAPLEFEPQNLGDVVAEAVRTARAAAGDKVTIKYSPPEWKIIATFDRTRILQTLYIFLDNAMKYTPEGGEVRIEVREKNAWVELEVSDTGIGIPREQLPFIFERFYRTDEARARGGAGLGLAIARQIAEAHDGSIEVQSEPGRGSTFVLRIPVDGPTN
jgi:signal transduction histidine kinase